MKRMCMFIGVFCLASGANAAKVDFDGMGRVRSSNAENYDFDDDAKDVNKKTNYRFELGFKIQKSDSTHLYIQPRFGKVAADMSRGQSSGALNDADSFDMHQAYIVHKQGALTFKAGRQELAYGDHLLIGTVGWHDVGRSFDGYKLSYTTNFGVTDVLYMTIKENGLQVDSDRDHDLFGAYHSGKISGIKNLDFYYLIDKDLSDKFNDKDQVVTSAGLRIKSSYKKMFYRVELTSQNIENNSSSETGSQYDLEFGYKFGELTFSLETAQADEYYKQLYPTGHKFLGFADLFKRQNISQTALHLKYKKSEKIKLSGSYHIFKVTKKDSNSHKWNYTAAEALTEDELGSEIDLVGVYTLEKGSFVQAGYSIFTPGKRFKEVNSKDELSYSFIQLVSKF